MNLNSRFIVLLILIVIFIGRPVAGQNFTPGFVMPNIVTPKGHPVLPKALKLTRSDWDLQGPVKECLEFDPNASTELDRKISENKLVFNQNGWLIRDYSGGSYGWNKEYTYDKNYIQGYRTRITLNPAGLPVSAIIENRSERYTYSGSLLTGITSYYRAQVEEMDGSIRIDSSQKVTKYRYDQDGRLVEHTESVYGQKTYRIYYRYNSAGQMDSLWEVDPLAGIDSVRCFTLSYSKSNQGDTYIHYKEKHPYKGYSSCTGSFAFSPEGRLKYSTCFYNEYYNGAYRSKQQNKGYSYDKYGNWITASLEDVYDSRVKEWQELAAKSKGKRIRVFSYY